ncbi:growth-regulating factor 6 isoform X3 [Triticum aestivum]|uniref:growth-regulating factor 6 isoform X3 n=1 Tax=Triticum aestivum TaxID=4565 RepID=UPI001D02355F|nr:growth-regulating factor 6-like isoform X3 [Triticum aestivum]
MDLGGVLMAAADAGVGGGDLGMLGSRLLKHGRGNAAAAEADEHGWGSGRPPAKQARVAASAASGDSDAVSEAVKAAAPYLLGTCSPGHGREKMLSFSSSQPPSCPSSAAAAAAQAALPLYYGTPASCSGLSSVSLSASIQNAMARVRGPFTPSQWMELEHQALIYKYLAANIAVPHNLLVPIRRSVTSLYPSAYFGSSTLGWGPFQLGYSGSADLEPGRCRRTDGKKWRCSRDAVADQKYCERHMNRGRHRSRKHVEGQPGHAAKAMPATVAAAAAQPGALATGGGGGATAGAAAICHEQQPLKNYAANTIDPCSLQYNREMVSKQQQHECEQVQDSDTLSMLTSMSARNTNTGSMFPFSNELKAGLRAGFIRLADELPSQLPGERQPAHLALAASALQRAAELALPAALRGLAEDALAAGARRRRSLMAGRRGHASTSEDPALGVRRSNGVPRPVVGLHVPDPREAHAVAPQAEPRVQPHRPQHRGDGGGGEGRGGGELDAHVPRLVHGRAAGGGPEQEQWRQHGGQELPVGVAEPHDGRLGLEPAGVVPGGGPAEDRLRVGVEQHRQQPQAGVPRRV